MDDDGLLPPLKSKYHAMGMQPKVIVNNDLDEFGLITLVDGPAHENIRVFDQNHPCFHRLSWPCSERIMADFDST